MQKLLNYISHKDALNVLDMGIKTFNKEIVPHVSMYVINRKKFYKIDDINKLLKEKEIITRKSKIVS